MYKGAIIDLVVDDVQLPNDLGKAKREIVLHNGAVAVLAVTPEKKLLIVKQYRKAIEAVSYEIPAGKLEKGEKGFELEAAARELEEETAYAGDLKHLYDFYTALGFCNEKISLYLAENIKKVSNPRPQDEDELIELLELSYQECLDYIAQGKIVDAKTIIAIQYYAQKFGGDL
ncbi:NUDIX hydrolase [Streptococcus didelphis]|nr:NUDIX hydrolase [Streptococcus didelphis]WMB30193.1 NUDIX hydrolase [Streptococcus didelphis]